MSYVSDILSLKLGMKPKRKTQNMGSRDPQGDGVRVPVGGHGGSLGASAHQNREEAVPRSWLRKGAQVRDGRGLGCHERNMAAVRALGGESMTSTKKTKQVKQGGNF